MTRPADARVRWPGRAARRSFSASGRCFRNERHADAGRCRSHLVRRARTTRARRSIAAAPLIAGRDVIVAYFWQPLRRGCARVRDQPAGDRPGPGRDQRARTGARRSGRSRGCGVRPSGTGITCEGRAPDGSGPARRGDHRLRRRARRRPHRARCTRPLELGLRAARQRRARRSPAGAHAVLVVPSPALSERRRSAPEAADASRPTAKVVERDGAGPVAARDR